MAGKKFRKGMSLMEAIEEFSTDEQAEKWFIEPLYPNGMCCPHCGSLDRVKEVLGRKPMPFHCGDCRRYFSVKTNTVMQRSRLPLRKWVLAVHLMSTNLKGMSSLKLARDLRISQNSEWHLAHRIREAWMQDSDTRDQIINLIRGMEGKRLTYAELAS